MKTIQEIRDEVARKEGHADWMTCCFRENLTSIELIMEQVAKLYAQEACREQREICAGRIFEWAEDIKDRRSAIDVALSAPEPKMI